MVIDGVAAVVRVVVVVVFVVVDRKEGTSHTRASAPWDINFHVLL